LRKISFKCLNLFILALKDEAFISMKSFLFLSSLQILSLLNYSNFISETYSSFTWIYASF
jgi:hypothetical protein